MSKKRFERAGMGRLCQCAGAQSVRLVHGDGQVLHVPPSTKVADVLGKHPHHYVCFVGSSADHKSAMLPLDAELEPGTVYLLLPLPRLFPSASSSPGPACSCYLHAAQSPARGPFSPLSLKGMITRMGSPARTPTKKVSPDFLRQSSMPSFEVSSANPYSPSSGKENEQLLLSPVYKKPGKKKKKEGARTLQKSKSANSLYDERDVGSGFGSLRWKPRLGCISETDAFVAACQEVRQSLDRRRLTFESRGRPPSPPVGPREHWGANSGSKSYSGSCRSPTSIRELCAIGSPPRRSAPLATLISL